MLGDILVFWFCSVQSLLVSHCGIIDRFCSHISHGGIIITFPLFYLLFFMEIAPVHTK